MKRLTMRALGVCLALLVYDPAYAWVEEGVLNNDETAWRDFWPPGLKELAAAPGRVHGRHMIAHSFGKGHERWAFYFQGDSKAFNQFITDYAALRQGEFSENTPLTLTLHLGKGEVRSLMGDTGDEPVTSPDFNWLLGVSAYEVRTDHPPVRVELELWISSSFPLNQLKVPSEIRLTTPFETFIDKHEQKRPGKGLPRVLPPLEERRLTLPSESQPSSGERVPPAGEKARPDGGLFWPTDQVVETWILIVFASEANQYGLTDEQTAQWKRMSLQRWKPYFFEIRLAWLLVRQFTEARFGPQPPDVELVKRWAKQARPVFDVMCDQVSAEYAELRGMIRSEQQTQFEDNSNELKALIAGYHQILTRWEQGEVREGEWWDSNPERRENRRLQWTSYIRAFEMAGIMGMISPPASRPAKATTGPAGDATRSPDG